MEIVNLPQDIFPDTDLLAEGIIIYEYAVKAGNFKGKSVLHQNAISLVLQGEKTMHFAEKTVVATADAFHFLSAGNCVVSMQLHEYEIFKSILIFIDDSLLTEFYIKHQQTIKASVGEKKVAPLPYISIDKDEFIRNYIASLGLLLGQQKHLSRSMKLLKFEELMLYLVEKHPETVLSFQPRPKNNFSDLEFRKIVESNIMGELSLDELAFLCKLSLSTFKRRFMTIYSTSPNKWLLKKRMEIAAGLLLNQQEKPSEIFFKVGYENHSSFSKSFRQVYGLSPKDYQAQKMNV